MLKFLYHASGTELQESEVVMVKFDSGHDVLGRVSIQSSPLKTAQRHRNCRNFYYFTLLLMPLDARF